MFWTGLQLQHRKGVGAIPQSHRPLRILVPYFTLPNTPLATFYIFSALVHVCGYYSGANRDPGSPLTSC